MIYPGKLEQGKGKEKQLTGLEYMEKIYPRLKDVDVRSIPRDVLELLSVTPSEHVEWTDTQRRHVEEWVTYGLSRIEE